MPRFRATETTEEPKEEMARPPVGANTEKVRNRRIPIFDPSDRMAFPENPSFHRVWVTDVKNQVQDFLDSGFTFVTRAELARERGQVGEGGDARDGSHMDSRVKLNVGRAHVKDNAEAFLMQIPKEEWEEIRAMIREERQKPMKEIHRQISGMKEQGFYGEGMKQEIKHFR